MNCFAIMGDWLDGLWEIHYAYTSSIYVKDHESRGSLLDGFK